MGGIVEEFLEYPELGLAAACSCGSTLTAKSCLLSTHDQILGGPSSQVYQGCRFPAEEPYRRQIQQQAAKVGKALARKGVVSRFGVDFFVGWKPGSEKREHLRGSRSTCASAARRTRSSPCSS